MVKIAIVEDTPEESSHLQTLLKRSFGRRALNYTIDLYTKPLLFLSDYHYDYDIIFMDIDLPGMDGMSAAHRLREIDQQVILIFVTRMAQFAIKGYEVNAMDYLIKPLELPVLERKIDRALTLLKDSAEVILVTSQNGAKRLPLREILYIEVQSHTLLFHTDTEVVHGSGTLSEMETQLEEKGFLRCNKCYLVNSRHISTVQGYTLTLDNKEQLQISRLRKAAFMTALAQLIGKR